MVTNFPLMRQSLPGYAHSLRSNFGSLCSYSEHKRRVLFDSHVGICQQATYLLLRDLRLRRIAHVPSHL